MHDNWGSEARIGVFIVGAEAVPRPNGGPWRRPVSRSTQPG